jgi:hypothetical protein
LTHVWFGSFIHGSIIPNLPGFLVYDDLNKPVVWIGSVEQERSPPCAHSDYHLPCHGRSGNAFHNTLIRGASTLLARHIVHQTVAAVVLCLCRFRRLNCQPMWLGHGGGRQATMVCLWVALHRRWCVRGCTG